MSEGRTPPRDRLGETIADALEDWPIKERSREDWDALADRVEERLDGVAASRLEVSDAKLFDAPLPQESGEPRGEATSEGRLRVADRARDRASFQELANFAKQAGLTPPPSGVHRSVPPARKEDSGVIDLKALEAQDALVATAPTPPPAAASSPLPPPPPPPPLAPVEPETKIVVVAPPSPPVAAIPAAAPEARPRSRGWVVATFGGLVAVAAAVALYLGPLRPHADSRESTTVAATPAKGAMPSATSAAAARSAQPADTDDAVDPNALPLANGPARAPSTNGSTPLVAKPMASAFALVPTAPTDTSTAQPQPQPTDTSTAQAAPAATATSTDDQSLDQALRAAAGVTPSSAPNAETPTAADPGSLPLRPSQGAAQSALSQVLPSARACVGPDDGESQVTVTFGPSGAAQRVSVGGGAAGKPAEACIRAAMMRAHVAPFTQSSFNWSAIVRGL